MLSNEKFDTWSETYDVSIGHNDSTDYPFAGYHDVLAYIQQEIPVMGAPRILDIGVGTGLLSQPLYNRGASIRGTDFSEKMLDVAQRKMPEGTFLCADFTFGIKDVFEDITFNYIISSYALHHLTFDEKVDILSVLVRKLTDDGKILIGDIAFENHHEFEKCKKKAGSTWDEDEEYFIASEIIPALRERKIKASYTKISFCAGVLLIMQ